MIQEEEWSEILSFYRNKVRLWINRSIKFFCTNAHFECFLFATKSMQNITASNIKYISTYLDTIFFIIRFQKFSDDLVLYFTLLEPMYYTYF